MSVDVVVFHSDEDDAPAGLNQGWYVGCFRCEVLIPDSPRGPYATKLAACKAARAGIWLKPPHMVKAAS